MSISVSFPMQSMQVFVSDPQGKTRTVFCHLDDRVQAIKDVIFKKTGIAPADQRLSFVGKPMRDSLSISDYGVSSASVINLSLRLLGGLPAERTLTKYIYQNMRSQQQGYLTFQDVVDRFQLTKYEDRKVVRNRLHEMANDAHHDLAQGSKTWKTRFYDQIEFEYKERNIGKDKRRFYHNLRVICNTSKHRQVVASKFYD